jgi:hypothetical protein
MRRTRIGIGLIAASLSLSAQAEPAFYLQSSLGYVDARSKEDTLDAQAGSLSAEFGWQITPNLALELGGIAFGDLDETEVFETLGGGRLFAERLSSTRVLQLGVALTLPVQALGDAEFGLRLGVGRWETELARICIVCGLLPFDGTPSGTDPYFDASMLWSLDSSWKLGAEVSRQVIKEDSLDVELDQVALKLRYGF